jgi:hypothetical protein
MHCEGTAADGDKLRGSCSSARGEPAHLAAVEVVEDHLHREWVELVGGKSSGEGPIGEVAAAGQRERQT